MTTLVVVVSSPLSKRVTSSSMAGWVVITGCMVVVGLGTLVPGLLEEVVLAGLGDSEVVAEKQGNIRSKAKFYAVRWSTRLQSSTQLQGSTVNSYAATKFNAVR